MVCCGVHHAQAIKAAGVSKDAEWITELHNNLADDITQGQPDRLLGVLLDNTKANRKALKELEEQHRTWLGLGCQAHALSLLLKDLANPSKAKWAASTFAAALHMSNTIGDSERVRALVQAKQVEFYGMLCHSHKKV